MQFKYSILNIRWFIGMHKLPSHSKQLYYLKIERERVVSQYVITEFEDSLNRINMRPFRNHKSSLVSLMAKVSRRIGTTRNITNLIKNVFFVPAMGAIGLEFKVFPVCYFAETIPYIFDCWPNYYKQVGSFLLKLGTKMVFFSSRQAFYSTDFNTTSFNW